MDQHPIPGTYQEQAVELAPASVRTFLANVWAEPGAAVRLRIEQGDSDPVTIDTVLVTAPVAEQWQTLAAPLQRYQGQQVTVRLEVQGAPQEPVFLSVPRLAITD